MFDYVFKRHGTWLTVLALDLIGSLLFLFRSKNFPENVRRILVVRLDHLGDLVLSTPFFSSLRKLYPAAEIHLACDQQYARLFENDTRFDLVIPVERHWLSRMHRTRWREIFQCVRELKRFRYDLGFDLRGDFRTIFFFLFLAGVKFRASYGIRGGGFLLNHSPIYPYRAHEIEKNLNLLSTFTGKTLAADPPELEGDPEVQKLMRMKLEKLGRNPSKKLIGAHLGAGYPSKQWGIEKFRRVLEAILDEETYQICLMGKKEEVTLPQEFLEQDGILNCLGGTTIQELVALIGLCDYFIGNDSGPAHVAAALGVPVLTVFSGTNRYEEWHPVTKASQIIHRDLECSPCEAQICPLGHHNCLELISTDEVLDGFRELVGKVETKP